MADGILGLGHLYRLTFPNGKVYIGITVRTVMARLRAHVRYAIAGKNLCPVHRALLKFGVDAVVVETLSTAPRAELPALEIAAIAQHNCRVPAGYNVSPGGEGKPGVPKSEEHKAKMRATWLGRKHSPEALALMSKVQQARVKTPEEKAAKAAAMRRPEVRAKLAEAAKGVRQSEETVAKRVAKLVGRKATEETREKMRLAQLGRTASDETRAKIGAASAGRAHGPEARAKISAALKGKTKSEEHRKALSDSRKGERHQPMSAETKEKIRAALMGKPKSPQAVANQIAARMQNKADKSSA